MSIALNMVVYNEEARLSKLLPVVRKYFDEIVIVDQASCDQTIAIARLYADKILIDKHWGSAQYSRPLAKRVTESEWLMWLDADEIPTDFLLTNLDSIVKSGPDAFILKYENRVDGVLDEPNPFIYSCKLSKKRNMHFNAYLHGATEFIDTTNIKQIEEVCILHHKSAEEKDLDHQRYIGLVRRKDLYIPEETRRSYGVTPEG